MQWYFFICHYTKKKMAIPIMTEFENYSFSIKRWEEIGVWQTGVRTEPNKTEPIVYSSHGGELTILTNYYKNKNFPLGTSTRVGGMGH
jgi:hypothetical protein